MVRKNSTPRSSHRERTSAYGDVHEWVLSLPWVVELPTDGTMPDVRIFAVDCAPLGRRQLWLVTGLHETLTDSAGELSIDAVMPVEATRAAEASGWEVHQATPLPEGHVLVTLGDEAGHDREEIEAFVLAAYSYAMV